MVRMNRFATAEIETQMYRTNVWTPTGESRVGVGDELGDWDSHVYTDVYKIHN